MADAVANLQGAVEIVVQASRQIALIDSLYCNAVCKTLWECFSADWKCFLSFRSRGQASKPQSQRTAPDKNRIWGRDHPRALDYHYPDVGWRVARRKAAYHVLQWQDSEVRYRTSGFSAIAFYCWRSKEGCRIPAVSVQVMDWLRCVDVAWGWPQLPW